MTDIVVVIVIARALLHWFFKTRRESVFYIERCDSSKQNQINSNAEKIDWNLFALSSLSSAARRGRASKDSF